MKEQEPLKRNIQDYRLLALAEKKSQGKLWALLTSKEITENLALTQRQVERLLSRMLSQKRIQQLQRGVYLAPGRLPPGKIWNPSSYEILWAYMNWLGATWQVTGLAAFSRYGFSTQVAQRISVYNDKLSGEIVVGGSTFVFVKLPIAKLGTITLFSMPGEIKIPFSSCARTIFDAIYDAKRFGTLPTAYTWISNIVKKQEDIEELQRCCLSYGNRQTIARIGFFLESIGIEASSLFNLLKKTPSKTFVPLIPGVRRGASNNRWQIIENISIEKILSEREIPDEDD